MANYLNTESLKTFLERRTYYINEYEDIKEQYRAIVAGLLKDWEGKGAEAFSKDADEVMKNLNGLQDVLTTMCDTLGDCLQILEECDSALGENNRNAMQQ